MKAFSLISLFVCSGLIAFSAYGCSKHASEEAGGMGFGFLLVVSAIGFLVSVSELNSGKTTIWSCSSEKEFEEESEDEEVK